MVSLHSSLSFSPFLVPKLFFSLIIVFFFVLGLFWKKDFLFPFLYAAFFCCGWLKFESLIIPTR